LIVIDAKAPRLMMPMSGKGGTRNPGQRKVQRYSVSISPELAALLKVAAKGRPSHAPLALRKGGAVERDRSCQQLPARRPQGRREHRARSRYLRPVRLQAHKHHEDAARWLCLP
jgi:hypothetical protein